MTGDVSIVVRGLQVVRGRKEVLHHLDLEIGAGAITGLLGPSGCGKSTLMRAIVGVQIVAAGEVTVLGSPAGSPGLRSRVGYVTQAPSIYGDLTVRQNLDYFARVLNADAAAVEQAVGAVSLGEQIDQLASDMSGGQRARVSLATALLSRPDVLVLDEPTVGLDPVLRVELWETFRGLADAGSTLLVSSHVMDEADRCDSILLMRDGELLAAEPREALLARTGAPDVETAFLQLVAGRDPA
jgi:ABC-2 type transport system ATP-binding protein